MAGSCSAYHVISGSYMRLRCSSVLATIGKMVSTSHKDDYKHSKEAFVSGMTGSTVSHINMISLVALVCRISLLRLHLLTAAIP